jgi:hypothetical protein
MRRQAQVAEKNHESHEYARIACDFFPAGKETNVEPQINTDEHRYETRVGICVHPCVAAKRTIA